MKLAAVLAAGASSRFGADKLAADFGGAPVLERTIRAVAASGADDIVCVLPPGATDRMRIAERCGVRTLLNPDAADGLSSSVARAAEEAQRVGAAALLVALGDAPRVPSAHYAALFDRAEAEAGLSFTLARDRRGPPAVFAARRFEDLTRLKGDQGARDMTARAPAGAGVALADALARDIDTPDDLRAALADLAKGG
ncbi:MAG: nucleotidyltransferase family protein [Pseudomonadota bacterium]